MAGSTGVREGVDPGAIVGYEYDSDADAPILGSNATVREGTIIYCDVEIGDDFSTGHYAIVREHTSIGDQVLVGTNAVIDGHTTIGSHVSLQSGVYIPSQTTIGSNVFLGPYAVLTNDRWPVRQDVDLSGPTIEDSVSIGANATVLPNVTIGSKSFVAAGAVVTEDVPPGSLAVGVPARIEPLPDELDQENELK